MFKRMFKKIKWFYQKITRGYSDCDLWNLDQHLAKLILPRLESFKKIKRCGVPNELCKPNEPIEESEKRWEETLDTMILAFRLTIGNYNWIEKEDEIKIQTGFANFIKYYHNLWD